jgi:predicted dehydrogenase
MADDAKVKTALIGCGGIAGAHVTGLADLHERGVAEAPQVVAVCDIDVDRAEERAQELAAFGPMPRVYDDVEDLLAAEDEVKKSISAHCIPSTTALPRQRWLPGVM